MVRALSRFLYKRTFITLREALADPDPTIVQEAAKALEELRFPHAFDPLARIYRESQSAMVRASAVRALAKIDTFEAAEMLLGHHPARRHAGAHGGGRGAEAGARPPLRRPGARADQAARRPGARRRARRAPEPQHQPAGRNERPVMGGAPTTEAAPRLPAGEPRPRATRRLLLRRIWARDPREALAVMRNA